MRKFIDCIKGYKDSPNMFPVDYSSELVNALKPLSTPFCLVSSFHEDDWAFTKPCIYNTSTCGSLDAAELLSVFSHQNQSTCKATEAGIDRRVVEIDAALLQLLTLSEIGARLSLNAFAPNHTLMVRPNKLLIHQEGYTEDWAPVVATSKPEGPIGMIVVILNSTYTGGELEVTHGDRTEVVTGPYSWVAMYGDCLHKINPVTSGTRVSLIYDIYDIYGDVSARNVVQDEDIWDYWFTHYAQKCLPQQILEKRVGWKGLSEKEKERLLERLDKKLTNSEDDGVIIALQKLYPEYQQIDPSSLEGADKTLYDILTTATVNPFRRIDYTVSNAPGNEKYDVKLVTVVIHRCQEEEDKHNHKTRCVQFNAAAVERELGKSYALDQVPGANYEKERDHEKRKQDVRIGVNTKVLLPYPLDMEGLLEHAPEKWSDGIPEQFVFVVTCLQVHKK